METYTIKTKRLGLRPWKIDDLDFLINLNQNEDVMHYFPSIQSEAQSRDFILRMNKCFKDSGYCYFAMVLLETDELLGFTGIMDQTNNLPFSPYTDIGWRLHPKFWKKGYVFEAAEACLQFAKTNTNLTEIISIAPKVNLPSISVMEKIGMSFIDTFQHPFLKEFPKLFDCVRYSINL